MKRKIFSKLLMVALVIAAVGSFVSCKDYDDDINNLQKQIDTKAALSELTALQSTLDSKIAAAQSAAQAAQATADAAATKTAVADLKTALETAIADAKKAGTDAGTQAGQAITAANKAQETADAAAQAAKDADAAAKKALEDALKTIEETYQTKAEAADAAKEAADALAAVKAIADAAYTKAAAEELQKEVDDLKTSLEGLQTSLEADIDKKIDKKIQEVNNAVASVDAIWKAITGIQLYGTLNGDNGFGINDFPVVGADLKFLHGQVKKNSLFGNNEDNAGQQGKEFITFTDKDSIRVENAIIVKVDPINATITKDQLKLVDSEGNDLSEFVEFGTPKPYTKLITVTRAASTGLWAIPVSVKDDVLEADFNKEVIVNYNKKSATHEYKLYALAVNNTEAEGRFVATTYDLAAIAGPYEAATTLNFSVNGKGVGTIHNRWNTNQTKAEDGAVSVKNPEYVWAAAAAATPGKTADGLDVPDTAMVKNAANKTNYVSAGAADNRVAQPCLEVEKDVAFKVAGFDATMIDYFYVVLDINNAIESSPSELNAWNSYKYEGLNKTVKATEQPLSITISEGTKDPEHDIIGFRVYAVNYDGTLADPDGRAFYVQVGGAVPANNATIKSDAEVAYTATSGATAADNHSGDKTYYELTLPEDGFETLSGDTRTFTLKATDYDEQLLGNVTVGYQLYSKNDGTVAADWKDAKYIRIVSVDVPGNWIDDAAAIEYTIEGQKTATDPVINSITLKLKKEMPDNIADGVKIKSGADVSGDNLYVYMEPYKAAGVTAATGPLGVRATADVPADKLAWGAQLAVYGQTDLAEVLDIDKQYAWSIIIANAAEVLTDATKNWDASSNKYKAANLEITNVAGTAPNLYVAVPAADIVLAAKSATDATLEYKTARWRNKIQSKSGAGFAMTINRKYTGISSYDEDGDPSAGEDYLAEAKALTIHFVDPWTASTNEYLKYQYAASYSSAAAPVAQWMESDAYQFDYAGANQMKWTATNTSVTAPAAAVVGSGLVAAVPAANGVYYPNAYVGAGYTISPVNAANNAEKAANAYVTFAQTAWNAYTPASMNLAIDLEQFLLTKNSIYPSAVAFNGSFDADVYLDNLFAIGKQNLVTVDADAATLPFFDGTKKAHFGVSITGEAADYFFPFQYNGQNAIQWFKAITAPATIAKDLTGTYKVQGYTTFGTKVDIISIPFTVKH